MKKIIYTFIVLLLSSSIFLPFGQASAQAPQSFKYQAVVRDGSGEIIADQQVGLQVSILQGSTTGIAGSVEPHTPTTNGFGLINLEIGKGTVVSGDFSGIDWGSDSYFIKMEIDASGGTSYTEMGVSPLLSVPYAKYAEQAGKKYHIGDSAFGGIVFWVDETGKHGLVTSKSDQHTYIRWRDIDGVNRITNATGDGIGAGEMNTMLIIAMQTNDNTSGNFAAKLCANLIETENGIDYCDWYLPSKYELNLMYINLHQSGIGDFGTIPYLSSTESEYDDDESWAQSFSDGGQWYGKKQAAGACRCIRKF